MTDRYHVRFDAPVEALATDQDRRKLAERIVSKFEVAGEITIIDSTKPGHGAVEFYFVGERWKDLDFDSIRDHVRDMLAGDFGDYGNTANVHAAGGKIDPAPVAQEEAPVVEVPSGFKGVVITGGPDGNSTSILNIDGTPIEGVTMATIELRPGELNRVTLVLDAIVLGKLKGITEDPLASKELGAQETAERRRTKGFGGSSS